MTRYCGRDFSEQDLALVRALIAEDPLRTRADLSRLACRELGWLKHDGGLKEMSCRVAMLRMEKDGLIQLPPPRCQRPQPRLRTRAETDPQDPIHAPAHALPTLQLQPVVRTPACGMNSSTATTTSASKPSPVRNCATGSAPGAA